MMIKAKNFAEFFAGVGLMHEGLRLDDWECVWANDICEEKRETYIRNFESNYFCLGDIWNFVENPDAVPDNVFLYTASFPCTDLSVAGARKGLAGKDSGTLNAFLEIVNHKKAKNSHPEVILLENVKGFLTSHRGGDVAFTVASLNKAGYVVDILELDAVYFTPQSRPRVFVVAVREELAEKVMRLKKPNLILDDWWSFFGKNPYLRTQAIATVIKNNENMKWGLFDVPIPENKKMCLGDVIEAETDNDVGCWWDEERKNHLFSQMSASHRNILASLIEKDHYSYGTVYRRMRKGQPMAELRADGIAGCLRTPRGGSSRQILVRAGFGNWSVRLLSPREYARLQGVRDSFILPKNPNKGYFAMGDAVCVQAINFISTHILLPAYQVASEQLSANEPACINKNPEPVFQ